MSHQLILTTLEKVRKLFVILSDDGWFDKIAAESIPGGPDEINDICDSVTDCIQHLKGPQHDYIATIKLRHIETGEGLAEAKAWVDQNFPKLKKGVTK